MFTFNDKRTNSCHSFLKMTHALILVSILHKVVGAQLGFQCGEGVLAKNFF